MWFKRITAYFSFLALLLCSCQGGNKDVSYSFRMGKENGTHMALSMVLTEDEMKSNEDKVLGKTFRLTAQYNTLSEDDDPEEIDSDDVIQMALNFAYNLLGDGDSVIGYYNITDKIIDRRKVVSIGFDIDDDLREWLRELFGEVNIDFVKESGWIEKVCYSTIDDKNLYMVLPVSMDDFVYQIYWYGYHFYVEDEVLQCEHVTPHEIGTHPTKEDVVKINNSTDYKSKHKDKVFRDFHALTLALTKD